MQPRIMSALFRLEALAPHHYFTIDQRTEVHCLQLPSLQFVAEAPVVSDNMSILGTQMLTPGTHPHASFGKDPSVYHSSLTVLHSSVAAASTSFASVKRYFSWHHQPLSVPRHV